LENASAKDLETLLGPESKAQMAIQCALNWTAEGGTAEDQAAIAQLVYKALNAAQAACPDGEACLQNVLLPGVLMGLRLAAQRCYTSPPCMAKASELWLMIGVMVNPPNIPPPMPLPDGRTPDGVPYYTKQPQGISWADSEGRYFTSEEDYVKAVGATPDSSGGGIRIGSKIWDIDPRERGVAIEKYLTLTDYKDWFNVGAEKNGKFPLVDFQKGNDLVSLKTVDTRGTSWFGAMEDHVVSLGGTGATINGNPADMTLDLRVQPGGYALAKSKIDALIAFGAANGVTVVVKEFKGNGK
jgi:hypothetical protein